MRSGKMKGMMKKKLSGTVLISIAADAVLACLSAGIVSIVLTAVFFRYVLNHSLSWSDELVRYLFVWFTLLGAAVTLREREHIRVEYFVEKLPAPIRRRVDAAMLVGICLFQAGMVVLGAAWVWSTRGSFTSALQWPLNLLFYAALPCSAALGLWYAIRRLMRGEFSERDALEDALPPADGGDAWKS
ncbi:MAG: TRAP transporter small permease [Kiritimatiellales bacterium]|nr:TRAP transporter small permease [Kiritimatiellales bacterium]